MDDAQTYDLLRHCRTTAVFQLESLGMRDLIKQLQPDRFDDLTAIVALFRPGPMQMADEFINRKHRKDGAVARLSASAARGDPEADLRRDPVSRAGDADRAGARGLFARRRRPAAPRDGQEEARGDGEAARGLRQGRDRARRRGRARASHIFDQMETFAGYGFNKSHAAAYALIAYQTAWLKAHFTEAYMAAVLTADIDNTDRLVVLKDDCKQYRHRARAARRQHARCSRSPSPASAGSATASAR